MKRKSPELRVSIIILVFMLLNAVLTIVVGALLIGTVYDYSFREIVSQFIPSFGTAAIVSAVIIGIMLCFSVTRCFNYILSRLKKGMHDFANGDVSFAMRRHEDPSEMGVVYAHFNTVIDTYTMLITDLCSMVDSHVKGFYDVRIKESNYKGDFEVIAKGINKMTALYVDDTIELLEVIREYSNGNFNVTTRLYEENWSWANEIMDNMKYNFQHITEEINTMAKNAAAGNFHVDVQMGNTKGEWANMFARLKDFVESIDEPLTKIEHNVVLMSQGDFSLLEGKFHGVFDVLQNACNLTNTKSEKNIRDIANILKAIAEGDLTTRDHEKIIYEPIRNALTTILDSLNGNMGKISSTSERLLRSSQDLANNANTLAEGSRKQTASIEELHASIELISQSAIDSSEKADHVAALSQQANDHAQNSDEDMKRMFVSMEEIKEASANISKVIMAIEDIAFQTNLLSLNASVEAARAGEHGKGFSVVAEEVRSLASRSQDSAKETTELIENSVDKVESGLKNVGDVESSLARIVEDVSQVSDMISQMAKITEEQRESITQALHGAGEIASVVQLNSGASEECASVSQEFAEQAKILKEMTGFYKVRI